MTVPLALLQGCLTPLPATESRGPGSPVPAPRCRAIRTGSGVLLLALLCWPLLSAAADVAHHRIQVELDPGKGRLRVEDTVSLPAGMHRTGSVRLHLNAGFDDIRSVGGRVHAGRGRPGAAVRELTVEPGDGETAFTLVYSGTVLLGPAGDGPGEWLDARGAHLGAGSAWYPRLAGGAPFTFDLSARVPEGWRAVAPGKEVRGDQASGARVPGDGVSRWVATLPVEGLDLVAGPFVVNAREEAWGRSAVWLRQRDDTLARTYLDAVARAVAFYSQLLGAYPFEKFIVVENLRQTGWGMPSFTLLGSRVMRLPFIPHTSLPHEVLHNWWGNGVLVDITDGNWAEGLTAYLADHLQAQRRGRGVRHRRDALARFRATGPHPPASRFISRHDRRSQSAGYDRPLMLFHMLRRARGDDAFIEALRELFRDGLARRVDAREVLSILAPPGEDWFTPWWQRADAPRLALQCCRVHGSDELQAVSGALLQVQPGEPFPLAVPVQVLLEGESVAREHVVRMTGRRHDFRLDLPGRPVMLTADGAFDVMRIPAPGELPPSLAEALDARIAIARIAPDLPLQTRDAFQALAARMQARVLREGEPEPPADALWLLGPDLPGAAHWREALDSAVRRGSSRVMVLRESTGRVVVVLDAREPPAIRALAAKLPHYGRYGLLGFDGDDARNVWKAEQAPPDSPMRVVLDSAWSERAMPLAPEHSLEAR